jgi:hypothetical protein
MDIHTINISGGYSGSVMVKKGSCKMEFPEFAGTMSSSTSDIKYYHLWLITPEKNNIELQLFRFADGEWYDGDFIGPTSNTSIPELLYAIKQAIIQMGI